MAKETLYTLVLDVRSGNLPEMKAFVERVVREMPVNGCRVRIVAVGMYRTSVGTKLLAGQFVGDGEALRRQLMNLLKAPFSDIPGELNKALAWIAKTGAIDKGSSKVVVVVSRRAWQRDAACSEAERMLRMSRMSVLSISPDNAVSVVALMRNSLNRRSDTAERVAEFRNYIVKNLQNSQAEIDVSRYLKPEKLGGYGWSQEVFDKHLEEIYRENPLLFHVSKEGGIQTWSLATGEIAKANLISKFVIPAREYVVMCKQVECAGFSALKAIAGIHCIAEKVSRLHDYLASHCKYELNAGGQRSLKYHTAYDALVQGCAVCEGISAGFMYLLTLAGIESKLVVSAEMHHCWNYVCVDGCWYHVDVTFDCPIDPNSSYGVKQYLTHDFFLLSDAALISKGKHHGWDRENLPAATDTRFDKRRW